MRTKIWKIVTDQLQKLISYEFLAGQELRTVLKSCNFNKDFQQLWPASKVNLIAKKINSGTRKNISDKKQGDKIFFDKNFFMKILLKLFNNRDHPEKWVYCLKTLCFSSPKHFKQEKQGQNIFWQNFFRRDFVEVVQQMWPSRKMGSIA